MHLPFQAMVEFLDWFLQYPGEILPTPQSWPLTSVKLWTDQYWPNIGKIFPKCGHYYPSAKLDTAQHWPSIAKNLPKIGCQYRAVAGMITPVCTWRSILAQTLAASTCFRHSNGPMLCRTPVCSIPEWFAVVKVTHGPVMCRPWARLWLFYFQNWMP